MCARTHTRTCTHSDRGVRHTGASFFENGSKTVFKVCVLFRLGLYGKPEGS